MVTHLRRRWSWKYIPLTFKFTFFFHAFKVGTTVPGGFAEGITEAYFSSQFSWLVLAVALVSLRSTSTISSATTYKRATSVSLVALSWYQSGDHQKAKQNKSPHGTQHLGSLDCLVIVSRLNSLALCLGQMDVFLRISRTLSGNSCRLAGSYRISLPAWQRVKANWFEGQCYVSTSQLNGTSRFSANGWVGWISCSSQTEDCYISGNVIKEKDNDWFMTIFIVTEAHSCARARKGKLRNPINVASPRRENHRFPTNLLILILRCFGEMFLFSALLKKSQNLFVFVSPLLINQMAICLLERFNRRLVTYED